MEGVSLLKCKIKLWSCVVSSMRLNSLVSEKCFGLCKSADLSLTVVGSLNWDSRLFAHLSSMGKVLTPSTPRNRVRKETTCKFLN